MNILSFLCSHIQRQGNFNNWCFKTLIGWKIYSQALVFLNKNHIWSTSILKWVWFWHSFCQRGLNLYFLTFPPYVRSSRRPDHLKMQSRLNMVWWLHQQLRRSLRFRNLESNQGREKIEETQQCWMVTQLPQGKVNWIHNPQSIQLPCQSSTFWLLSNHLTVHQHEDKEAVKMSQKPVQYTFKITS